VSASLGILIDDFAHGRNSTPLPAGLSTLTWQTKVANILPGAWKLMDPWASEKANLIDILTHVSGLSRCASHSMALCMYSGSSWRLGGQTRLVIQVKFQCGGRNGKSPKFASLIRASRTMAVQQSGKPPCSLVWAPTQSESRCIWSVQTSSPRCQGSGMRTL
jgi:hypothetical protein